MYKKAQATMTDIADQDTDDGPPPPTIGDNNPPAVLEFVPYAELWVEFEARYSDVKYNLDDPDQERRAKFDRRTIGKAIANLDRTHAELKAPLREKTMVLDGERKRIKDGMLLVQGVIKDQLDAKVAREEARVAGLAERVQNIRAYGVVTGVSSEVLRTLIEEIKTIELDDSFEEFKAEAALALSETMDILTDALRLAEEWDAKEAELVKLRAAYEARERAAREEKIRAEAEAEARAKAEALARAELRAAEERAEREQRKAAAEARAKLDAETKAWEERQRKAAAQLEKQRAAEAAEAQAEKDAIEAHARAERDALEAEKREAQEALEREVKARKKADAEAKAKAAKLKAKAADEAHRGTVEAAILDAVETTIESVGDDRHDISMAVLSAIVAGEIPHVSITY